MFRAGYGKDQRSVEAIRGDLRLFPPNNVSGAPRAPPADAGQFDRSGLWINADDGGYRVTYVVAGSPAAEGGVATGDLITSIGGKPAIADHLSDTRTMLRALPAGTQLTLTLQRGAAGHSAIITLRDQI